MLEKSVIDLLDILREHHPRFQRRLKQASHASDIQGFGPLADQACSHQAPLYLQELHTTSKASRGGAQFYTLGSFLNSR